MARKGGLCWQNSGGTEEGGRRPPLIVRPLSSRSTQDPADLTGFAFSLPAPVPHFSLRIHII